MAMMEQHSSTYHELVPCNPQDFAAQERPTDCVTGPVLQCATCDKPFLFESHMLQHQRVHLLSFLRRSLARRSNGFRVVCTLSLEAATMPLSRMASAEPLPLDPVRIRAREKFNDQLDVLSLTGDRALNIWPRRRAYECRLCRLQFGLKRVALDHAEQHSQSAKCNFCGLDCQSVEAKLAHERRQHKEDIRKAVKARRQSKAAKVKAEGAAADSSSAQAAQTFYPHLEAPLAGSAFTEQYATILQCQNCHYCFTSLAALTDHVTNYRCQPAQPSGDIDPSGALAFAIGSSAGATDGSDGQQQSSASSMFVDAASESLRLVSSNELQCIQGLYHLRGAVGEAAQPQDQPQPIYYVDSSAIDPRLYMPVSEAGYLPVESLAQQQQQYYYAYPAPPMPQQELPSQPEPDEQSNIGDS
uniref:C2H2-type domain-containing protein n=2 Tax=Macrostomum lignano TaxID=282301 RepID=A0A1I8GAY3_9PLAT